MARRGYIWHDLGWANIVSNVSKLSSARVQAGVVGEWADKQHPNSDLTVGEIALINEFGSDDGHTPERSFIRSTINNAAQQMESIAAAAARRVVIYKVPAQKALGDVGQWAVDAIRKTIESVVPPAQAAATRAKKGHDHTLVETGILWDSISFQIVSALENALQELGADAGYSFPMGGE